MEKEKKKKSVEVEITSGRDELAEALAESINKNSDGKVAFFLDAEDDPSQIVDWVSSGNSLVDLAIANRPNAGLPVGRIIRKKFNGCSFACRNTTQGRYGSFH